MSFELNVPNFEIFRGEMVGVVGSSGCGKSTLLDLLALMLAPDAASSFQLELPGQLGPCDVLAAPQALRAQLRQRYFGYILQTGGLLQFLSLKENIALPAQLNGMTDAQERTVRLAREFGIEDQLGKKPRRVSGGQRQRAAVARALIHDPVLILADEPTAAVDSDRAVALLERLRLETSERGMGLILVSHDVSLVERFADRTYGFQLEHPTRTHTISHCAQLPMRRSS